MALDDARTDAMSEAVKSAVTAIIAGGEEPTGDQWREAGARLTGDVRHPADVALQLAASLDLLRRAIHYFANAADITPAEAWQRILLDIATWRAGQDLDTPGGGPDT